MQNCSLDFIPYERWLFAASERPVRFTFLRAARHFKHEYYIKSSHSKYNIIQWVIIFSQCFQHISLNTRVRQIIWTAGIKYFAIGIYSTAAFSGNSEKIVIPNWEHKRCAMKVVNVMWWKPQTVLKMHYVMINNAHLARSWQWMECCNHQGCCFCYSKIYIQSSTSLALYFICLCMSLVLWRVKNRMAIKIKWGCDILESKTIVYYRVEI